VLDGSCANAARKGRKGRYNESDSFPTSSAVFLALNFFNRFARWNSTVRGLIASRRATSLLVCPAAISTRISCSRGVRPTLAKREAVEPFKADSSLSTHPDTHVAKRLHHRAAPMCEQNVTAPARQAKPPDMSGQDPCSRPRIRRRCRRQLSAHRRVCG